MTPLIRRSYDLRHSGITWRLNSGVPATEIGAWAGHSVEMLMRVWQDGPWWSAAVSDRQGSLLYFAAVRPRP